MSTKKYSHPAPLAMAIGSALAVSTTQAAMITVNTNADPGGSEVCSLRSAIEAINTQASVDGCASPTGRILNTIQFDQSVTGSIELNDGMLQISESVNISGPGADFLSIDANGSSGVFKTTNGTIEISGLTITGGGNVPYGGGVYVSGTSQVTLSDCLITGNEAAVFGGGVLQYAPSLEIDNCSITNNSSGGFGGGAAIYLGTAEVRNSIVSDNFAENLGGGLWVAGIFDDNERPLGRGGLPFEQAVLHVESSTISGNEALYGGGGIAAGNQEPAFGFRQHGLLALRSSSDQNVQARGGLEPPVVPNLVIVESDITGNESDYGGGVGTFGYYVDDGPILLSRGLYQAYGRYNLVEIYQSSITANAADELGGGMFLKYSETLLYGSEVSGNSAANGGAGIFNAGNEMNNGGIYSAAERGVSSGQFKYLGVMESVIANNQLLGSPERGAGPPLGAGIFNGLGESVVMDSDVSNNLGADFGGGIAGLYGISLIADSTVSGNEGGGLLRSYGGVMGSFNSRIEHNTDSGGMICEGEGFCLAMYSSITDNQGDVVGGIANNMGLFGGGVRAGRGGASQGVFYLANSTVSSNVGGNVGGIAGIYVEVRHATVAMNQQISTALTADGKRGFASTGGALLDDDLSLINHSIIAGNSSDNGTAQDLVVFGGGPIAMNYSLVQHDQGFTATGSGNILDQDPLLGPLDFNGSPVSRTHALLEGSPAIDAGDPGLEADFDYDQRGPGFPRVFNNVIDMGAFELSIDEIFADRFEPSP